MSFEEIVERSGRCTLPQINASNWLTKSGTRSKMRILRTYSIRSWQRRSIGVWMMVRRAAAN